MAYYCPFCGEKAYRGHRDYKCGNEDCENHQEAIFGLNKQLDRNRYTSDNSATTAN